MLFFIFPDGSVGTDSSRKEAVRRFRSFEKGEEIVDFDDNLFPDDSVPVSDSTFASDDFPADNSW